MIGWILLIELIIMLTMAISLNDDVKEYGLVILLTLTIIAIIGYWW